MTQELQDYIKRASELGLSKEEIINNLRKVGWSEEQINEGFQVIKLTEEKNNISEPQNNNFSQNTINNKDFLYKNQEIKHKSYIKPIIFVLTFFLILWIGVYAYWNLNNGDFQITDYFKNNSINKNEIENTEENSKESNNKVSHEDNLKVKYVDVSGYKKTYGAIIVNSKLAFKAKKPNGKWTVVYDGKEHDEECYFNL